jgi:hypothetical protein
MDRRPSDVPRTDNTVPPTPAPASQELLDLWARVVEAPHKYRLTDLDARTVWALTMRDGWLVPEVEVVCDEQVMSPAREEPHDAVRRGADERA